MARFTTHIIDKREIAKDTFEVLLEKPQGMDFRAGQNINLKLPELKYEDARGPRRSFTISSAPQHKELVVTMRHSGSGFKKTLLELPPGTELEFMGPNGRFYLYDSVTKAVFLAGGIGITPFKSMIEDAANSGQVHLTLFYSNPELSSLAYHELFVEYANKGRIQYFPTLSREEESWQGLTGRIDAGMIKSQINSFEGIDFFCCGPPAMVEELKTMLAKNEVPEDRIHSESFFGY